MGLITCPTPSTGHAQRGPGHHPLYGGGRGAASCGGKMRLPRMHCWASDGLEERREEAKKAPPTHTGPRHGDIEPLLPEVWAWHAEAAESSQVNLLVRFQNYMSEHLLNTGADITPREGDELSQLPYLCTWFHMYNAIIFLLSNDTVQINFTDHTKVILCPLMAAVSYTNKKQEFRTYKLNLIKEFGCCEELSSRLHFACILVEKLLGSKL